MGDLRMGTIPNTFRRNGIYYFRRRVPTRLRACLGRDFICISLRTHRFDEAQRVSRALYLRCEELFAISDQHPRLSDEQIAALIKDMYQSHLDADNEARIARGRSFDPDLIEDQRAKFAKGAEQARIALGTNDLDSAAFKVAEIIDKHDFTGKLAEADIRRLQQAVLRAAPDLYAALDARYRGEFSYEPQDSLLKSATLTVTPSTPVSQPDGGGNAETLVNDQPLSQRADTFRGDQVRRGNWSQHYGNQARNSFRLFIETAGDRPLSAYSREDARKFKELLSDLPSNYSKDPAFAGVTISQIASRTKKLRVPRLSTSTVSRHLNTLSQLWAVAIEAQEPVEPIFSGWKQKRRRQIAEPRKAWTNDKLKALFASPIWTGCKSRERRAEAGTEIIRDERFWIPLIAVHSGMRLEEICQLELADVRKEDGHWVFDINRANGKHVKNPSSVRTVPIHSEILKIGLIRHYSELHAKGQSRLFPSLDRAAGGKYGTNFTKWFGHYRKAIGVYEAKLDFHSFRHTATTLLRWADVPKPVIARILGHTETGETGNYGASFQIGQLREALEQIDTGLDLSHLYLSQGEF